MKAPGTGTRSGHHIEGQQLSDNREEAKSSDDAVEDTIPESSDDGKNKFSEATMEKITHRSQVMRGRSPEPMSNRVSLRTKWRKVK